MKKQGVKPHLVEFTCAKCGTNLKGSLMCILKGKLYCLKCHREIKKGGL